MNSISFDVEVINGNTDYIYRLKQSADSSVPIINEFVHKMIINNYIKCLVPYTYEIQDEYRRLRYSVAPQTVLSDYLKNRFTDISSCVSVIVAILKALKVTEEYMLDRRFILLNADYMYINRADRSVSLMCIPVNSAAAGSLTEFMRSIIMPLNFEGLRGSDALKVTVYQYNFDSESIENAIEYFSSFGGNAAEIPAEKTPAPVSEAKPTPEAPKPAVSIPKIPSFIKKSEPPRVEEILVAPQTVTEKQKEKKHGLFSGIFDSGNKKSKPKPEPVSPSNPFGINIPGQSEKAVIPEIKPMSFPEINIPEPKKEQPVRAAVPAAMRVEEDERTIMDGRDDGTVFLGDNSSSARLVDSTGEVFEITGEVFTIGRSGKSGVKIDLDLPSKTVSHLHATIYHENGAYFICDNGSANGTFLNSSRLSPNQRKELTHGSRLRISNIDFVFEVRG